MPLAAHDKGAEPIIRVAGLTARYGSLTILRDVSFTVDPGEVLVICGGSGCGKSTLLKHMIGLYQPAEGKVEVMGVDPERASQRELDRFRRQVGVLFQSGALLGSMTLAENIALPLRHNTKLPPRDIARIVALKLHLVGLSGYEHHLPSELSGGMQKRAGLARALAVDPAVVFFDEPSAGLDPVTSAGLDHLITRLNRSLGTTMIIVTHELESIFSIAHRVVMLDKEERGIIAQGSPDQLAASSDKRVHDFFHRLAEND